MGRDDGIGEETAAERARAREYIDTISKRLKRHLDDRPLAAALSALVALEDKLLKNAGSVRSPNCLLTTLLSAQNTRREFTKERSLQEVLQRCDAREKAVIARLEKVELRKLSEDVLACSQRVPNGTMGSGPVPVSVAARLYTLVKEGTPLSQLKDVYRTRYGGDDLEMKKWGFSKVTALLASIPGIQISKTPDGRNQMTVIVDDDKFQGALRSAAQDRPVPLNIVAGGEKPERGERGPPPAHSPTSAGLPP